jgi:hypothetical protein
MAAIDAYRILLSTSTAGSRPFCIAIGSPGRYRWGLCPAILDLHRHRHHRSARSVSATQTRFATALPQHSRAYYGAFGPYRWDESLVEKDVR